MIVVLAVKQMCCSHIFVDLVSALYWVIRQQVCDVGCSGEDMAAIFKVLGLGPKEFQEFLHVSGAFRNF